MFLKIFGRNSEKETGV